MTITPCLGDGDADAVLASMARHWALTCIRVGLATRGPNLPNGFRSAQTLRCARQLAVFSNCEFSGRRLHAVSSSSLHSD
jgi:hypothetical protein